MAGNFWKLPKNLNYYDHRFDCSLCICYRYRVKLKMLYNEGFRKWPETSEKNLNQCDRWIDSFQYITRFYGVKMSHENTLRRMVFEISTISYSYLESSGNQQKISEICKELDSLHRRTTYLIIYIVCLQVLKFAQKCSMTHRFSKWPKTSESPKNP